MYSIVTDCVARWLGVTAFGGVGICLVVWLARGDEYHLWHSFVIWCIAACPGAAYVIWFLWRRRAKRRRS